MLIKVPKSAFRFATSLRIKEVIPIPLRRRLVLRGPEVELEHIIKTEKGLTPIRFRYIKFRRRHREAVQRLIESEMSNQKRSEGSKMDDEAAHKVNYAMAHLSSSTTRVLAHGTQVVGVVGYHIKDDGTIEMGPLALGETYRELGLGEKLAGMLLAELILIGYPDRWVARPGISAREFLDMDLDEAAVVLTSSRGSDLARVGTSSAAINVEFI